MPVNRLIFRRHAAQRMFQRQITAADVGYVLQNGQLIEDYPNDVPYASRLVLGFVGSRPIHVVAADNAEDQETIVITVYEPDPARWDAAFRKRK